MGVTYTGKQLIIDLLNGDSNSNLTHMGWGTGSTPFAVTDTALGSELFPSGAGTSRNAFSSVVEDFTTRQEIYNAELLSEQNNPSSIYEIGLFNASSGGTLFSRRTFYKTEKTVDLEIQVEYAVGVTQE